MGRWNHFSVRECSETNNAQVDADDRTGRMDRLLYFPFGLNGDEPLVPLARNREVRWLALEGTAIAVADPAELRQKQAIVSLFDAKLLRIGIAEALPCRILLLEPGWLYYFVQPDLSALQFLQALEVASPSNFQVSERLLCGVDRSICQPYFWCFTRLRRLSPQLRVPLTLAGL